MLDRRVVQSTGRLQSAGTWSRWSPAGPVRPRRSGEVGIDRQTVSAILITAAAPRSSSGLGRRVLIPVTGVRVPYGVLFIGINATNSALGRAPGAVVDDCRHAVMDGRAGKQPSFAPVALDRTLFGGKMQHGLPVPAALRADGIGTVITSIAGGDDVRSIRPRSC